MHGFREDCALDSLDRFCMVFLMNVLSTSPVILNFSHYHSVSSISPQSNNLSCLRAQTYTCVKVRESLGPSLQACSVVLNHSTASRKIAADFFFQSIEKLALVSGRDKMHLPVISSLHFPCHVNKKHEFNIVHYFTVDCVSYLCTHRWVAL
jgi:hypothetical protein